MGTRQSFELLPDHSSLDDTKVPEGIGPDEDLEVVFVFVEFTQLPGDRAAGIFLWIYGEAGAWFGFDEPLRSRN